MANGCHHYKDPGKGSHTNKKKVKVAARANTKNDELIQKEETRAIK